MIKIENTALFGFDFATVNGRYSLINITVDPEVVELKNYRRTPFASIIIDSEDVALQLKKISKPDGTNNNPLVIKRQVVDLIIPVLENSALATYNSYIDAKYDDLRNLFPDMNFHTVILYVKGNAPVNDYDKSILIGGYPIRGFVSPINKSPDYSLLNGAFISTKLFSMKNIVLEIEPWMKGVYTDDDFLYYDKIVYILSDIKTKFEFHEYLQISETLGYVNDYIYTPELCDDTLEIVRRNSERKIPVNGREYLFQKPDKNMFQLSDIPNDIMMHKHNLMKKI